MSKLKTMLRFGAPFGAFGLVLFLTQCQTTTAKPPGAKVCTSPTLEWEGGQLIGASRNDKYLCYFYGFIAEPSGYLCAHVLCSPVDDCSQPLRYQGSDCTPPEEPIQHNVTEEVFYSDDEATHT